jgi:hypothetical protein
MAWVVALEGVLTPRVASAEVPPSVSHGKVKVIANPLGAIGFMPYLFAEKQVLGVMYLMGRKYRP